MLAKWPDALELLGAALVTGAVISVIGIIPTGLALTGIALIVIAQVFSPPPQE